MKITSATVAAVTAFFAIVGCTPHPAHVAQDERGAERPGEAVEDDGDARSTEQQRERATQESSVEATQSSSEDGELWRWDLAEGESYGLHYDATTDISISFGGAMAEMMGQMVGDEISDQITTETELELQVEQILPDGRYDLRIPVRQLVIESATGDRITLADLPDEVRVLRAYMTPRGTVEFYERVMVEVRDEGAYGIVRMSQDGSTTSGEATLGAGDMEVTARAEVDPDTGTVSLSQEVREREPRTREVEEERPVQHIDVLPADILSLLELPEGPIASGDRVELATPIGTMNMDVGDDEQCSHNRCGKLRLRMDVDSAPTAESSAETAEAGEGAVHGDMDMGMDMDMDMDMDMGGGMAMPGMPAGDGDGPMAGPPAMRADVDATILFEVDNGRLFNIDGRSASVSGGGGMEIEESTKFTLIFLDR